MQVGGPRVRAFAEKSVQQQHRNHGKSPTRACFFVSESELLPEPNKEVAGVRFRRTRRSAERKRVRNASSRSLTRAAARRLRLARDAARRRACLRELVRVKNRRDSTAAGRNPRGGCADHGRAATGDGRRADAGACGIPSIRLSASIVDTDDDEALGFAVGYLPDTPKPWVRGNSVSLSARARCRGACAWET
jgi:hypothetical protein